MMTIVFERLVRPFEQSNPVRRSFRPEPLFEPMCEDIEDGGAEPDYVALRWSASISLDSKRASAAGFNFKTADCEDPPEQMNTLFQRLAAETFALGPCDPDEDHIEIERVTHDERVFNPDDAEQFVDVEVVDEIRFRLPKLVKDLLGVEGTRFKLNNNGS
jgi:hypothetical protein